MSIETHPRCGAYRECRRIGIPTRMVSIQWERCRFTGQWLFPMMHLREQHRWRSELDVEFDDQSKLWTSERSTIHECGQWAEGSLLEWNSTKSFSQIITLWAPHLQFATGPFRKTVERHAIPTRRPFYKVPSNPSTTRNRSFHPRISCPSC
jgi:hypothetical protein